MTSKGKDGGAADGYFSFAQRDRHHWDVSNGDQRIFAVRGVPGNIFIGDERTDHAPNIGPFQTALGAAMWIADAMLAERSKP